jgi:hypothetical protein
MLFTTEKHLGWIFLFLFFSSSHPLALKLPLKSYQMTTFFIPNEDRVKNYIILVKTLSSKKSSFDDFWKKETEKSSHRN